MKKIMIIAAALAAVSATPVMADSISAEVKMGDVRGGHPDSTSYAIRYDAPLVSIVTYGAEVEVSQGNNAGSVSGIVSGRLGAAAPTFAGFNTQVYGELGESLRVGNNSTLWGLGVDVNHKLIGPFSIKGGFRHREGFAGNWHENRAHAGLGLGFGRGNKVEVTYYRTDGSTRSDAIGVGLSHKF